MSNLSLIKNMGNKAFIFCETCETFYDIWKEEDTIDDHKECEWRYVNDEEFKECLDDCMEWCLK